MVEWLILLGLSEVGVEVENGIGNRKNQVFVWMEQIVAFGVK